MNNEKHEFLYNYARAALEDELQRFRNIEDKSAKYLSLLSVGVVAYTVILRFYSSSFFPAENPVQWLACITVAMTYLAMASSWSFLYRALRLTEMPRLPFNNEFIETYEPESLPTIHFALTRACLEAIEHARNRNSEKTNLLIKGYKEIALAMWALTFSVILILSSNLTTTKRTTMSEEESSSKSTQQQPPAEPNKDVPPPKVTFVLDHAIKRVEKGQQQINESGKKGSEK